jgi:hypothetical protein
LGSGFWIYTVCGVLCTVDWDSKVCNLLVTGYRSNCDGKVSHLVFTGGHSKQLVTIQGT